MGGVGAVATLASYFGNLQLTLAVTSGIVVTGLLLAFSLKEDRFDVKARLYKEHPFLVNILSKLNQNLIQLYY